MKIHLAAAWLAPLLALGLASAPAAAAPPDVPDRIAYQGSLFDDTGAPRTGVVDLTVRLYDAAFGGTLLYKQIYLATPLTDGVFHIELGPTGEATASPTNPLTTSLIDVFEGDLSGTAPGRFLQLTVGNNGALGRTQILASPFALRAAVADAALSADVATSATQFGGLSGAVLSELYEHTNLDGSGPGNTDPTEGLADVDGDGAANFVDADNDGDGLDDSTEVAQGSDINLVTPTITGFDPAVGETGVVGETAQVTVLGTSFDPGLSVVFGSETPTPSNLTSTQFDVTVEATPSGTRGVQVTLPNGESDSSTYDFQLVFPTITGFDPAQGTAGQTSLVTVFGTEFDPGMTVNFGSESPTPFNVTSTQFDVTVNPSPAGSRTVQVILPPGGATSTIYNFVSPPPVHDIGTSADAGMVLRLSSTTQPLIAGADEYGVDTGGTPDLEAVALSSAGGPAVAWGPGDVLYGLRCRVVASDCVVELMRDDDADRLLEAGEVVATLETLVGISAVRPILDFDAAGRAVAAYQVDGPGADAPRFARDLDGDDDFDGPGELLVLPGASFAPTTSLDLAISPTGTAAFAHFNFGGGLTRVYHDRSGDGDFDDSVGGNPETFDVYVSGTAGCTGLAFDPSGRLALVSGGQNQAANLWRDLNADGDFDDAGEMTNLAPAPGGKGCDADDHPTGLAVVYHDGANVQALQDLNDDGDFDDAGEQTTLTIPVAVGAEVSVAIDGEGEIWAATSDGRLASDE